jgi:two-component system, OmpR family, phosphate regulon sensor histidine kinase PhoR
MASTYSGQPDMTWSDRLRRSAIVLLVGAGGLAVLSIAGAVAPLYALLFFLSIVCASLVPWRLHDARQASGLTEVGADPADSPIVNAVIASSPDPVVLLGRTGRVAQFNEGASRLAPALRRGEPAQFALRSPEIVAALRQAVVTAETQRVQYLERVPVERWMEMIVTRVAVQGNALQDGGVRAGQSDAYLLMTFHDLTPLRRVEELRADFVANASHELRTPLAALSGFIETLQGPARDDASARERFLGIMRQQALRMARLIDDLLSLSRIELSEHVRPDTPVDVVPIVKQVADGLESLAKERGVELTLDIAQASAVITGDRDELLRLFENLIENALKYGASGGKVMVALTTRMQTDGVSEVSVAVKDFGPGIPPEHLPRLTERFYRVDVGDSRSQGGTGLGLSLVKHITTRHRGRLAIESTLGEGATFTVTFPQASTPERK